MMRWFAKSPPEFGWISSDAGNEDWVCDCGNDTTGDGFSELGVALVNQSGTIHGYGYKLCNGCGRIMDPLTHQADIFDLDTGKMVHPGQSCKHPHAVLTSRDQTLYTHRVKIVGFYPLPPEGLN